MSEYVARSGCPVAVWAVSVRELAADWQALCHLGRHEDNRPGRKIFCKGCPNWSLDALTTCLADCAQAAAPGNPLTAYPKGCDISLVTCFQKLAVQKCRIRLCRVQGWEAVKDNPWWEDVAWLIMDPKGFLFVSTSLTCHPDATQLYF